MLTGTSGKPRTKMPSPTDVKSIPGTAQSKTVSIQPIPLSALSNGDKVWEQQVMAKSMDPDAPPLLLGWNLRTCEEFYNKAVSYGEQGGLVLPPAPILNGAHPVGAATTAALQRMQFDIVTYVATRNPGSSVIGGVNGSVGLACTFLQFAESLAFLVRLELQDWFHSVLTHGEALSGPLATMYMPHAKVSSGLFVAIPCHCELWL